MNPTSKHMTGNLITEMAISDQPWGAGTLDKGMIHIPQWGGVRFHHRIGVSFGLTHALLQSTWAWFPCLAHDSSHLLMETLRCSHEGSGNFLHGKSGLSSWLWLLGYCGPLGEWTSRPEWLHALSLSLPLWKNKEKKRMLQDLKNVCAICFWISHLIVSWLAVDNWNCEKPKQR